jgi:hypothetical protein
MKKPILWLNGDRMLMQSGHKTFDRQCRAILTGQQVGDCVTSFYIRPYKEVECNSMTFPLGHLRECDFNFIGTEEMPASLRSLLEFITTNESVLLYKFFHHTSNRTIVDGFVATRNGHCVLKSVTGPRASSQLIVAEAARYVSVDADRAKFTPAFA